MLSFITTSITSNRNKTGIEQVFGYMLKAGLYGLLFLFCRTPTLDEFPEFEKCVLIDRNFIDLMLALP